MKTSSLEILEKAELPPGQARAILKVMESELALACESLATKSDLKELKGEVTAEIRGVEGQLSRWVLTCILGQTAVLAGLGCFLLARVAR